MTQNMQNIRKLGQTFVAIGILAGCATPVYEPLPSATETARIEYPRTRMFRVDGEVKSGGRQFWLGPIRLSQAIQSVGGLTDFADRKRVEIRRRDGTVEQYSYNHIIKSPTNDPPVWPHDIVEVKRKRFIW
jgi:protein involved in polysaccharide export with SLBB domain